MPIGPVRVGQAGPGAADGVGHRGDRLVLADDPLVEHVLQADQLVDLALHEPGHGHAGPAGHDLGDVLLVDLLLQHRALGAARSASWAETASSSRSQHRQVPVAHLGGPVAGRPRARGGQPRRSGVSMRSLRARIDSMSSFSACQRAFMARPSAPAGRRSPSRSLSRRSLEALSDSLASATFSISRLADLALDDVDLGRHRVDLDAQLGGRLVDEVDGLVGQEAVGQVAVGEHGRARPAPCPGCARRGGPRSAP